MLEHFGDVATFSFFFPGKNLGAFGKWRAHPKLNFKKIYEQWLKT
jgi:hypothetical protein